MSACQVETSTWLASRVSVVDHVDSTDASFNEKHDGVAHCWHWLSSTHFGMDASVSVRMVRIIVRIWQVTSELELAILVT